MKPPCETVVKQVLPTIRMMLVKDLMERHEMNQVEVAKILGITQPAVSQYLSARRGNRKTEKTLTKYVGKSIKKFSDDIASGKFKHADMIKRYCVICKSMGKKEVLCVLHAESAPYLIEEGCRVCISGSRR